MKYQINRNKLREEIKKKIFDGFERQAIEATGINGLEEESISFEIFNDQEFVGAIVVQPFWGQLHVKYLFVEKNYRNQGIGRELIDHIFRFGKQRGYHFIFIETMSFQALKFYQKMGFKIDFSRSGYVKNTTLHYLKKDLNIPFPETEKQVTRLGVYGVLIEDGKILLVCQKKGPYVGKFDFPGGGLEFGEPTEQALRREFVEEVAVDFDSLQLIDNLTAKINVCGSALNDPYEFFHIGMIYSVEGYRSINEQSQQELQSFWIDPKTLSEEQCSSLLWKYKQLYMDG